MLIENFNNMLYNLDEICLIPSHISDIDSRSQCNPTEFGMLPVYITPMNSLIDESNINIFAKDFYTILPRSVDFETRFEYMKEGYTVAFGFREVEHLYGRFSTIIANEGYLSFKPHICIDQANGHMKSLLKLCSKLKDLLGQNGIWIMAGNIANPLTYYEYAEVGVDAIRIGIGSGSVCTTSLQTGIHYPMGSLIDECWKAKSCIQTAFESDVVQLVANNIDKSIIDNIKELQNRYKSIPVIIADGGFTKIDQIVKALALGADYVMLGEMVSHMKEACGPIYNQWSHGELIECRNYYGMSTVESQEIINNNSISPSNKIKPSEGANKKVVVNTDIKTFKESLTHALKSSMSYTNAKNLDDFIGKVDWEVMNINTLNKA